MHFPVVGGTSLSNMDISRIPRMVEREELWAKKVREEWKEGEKDKKVERRRMGKEGEKRKEEG